MQIIEKYFSSLSEEQQQQFYKLNDLYRHWNAQINVISRKDIDNLYLHHILHSLSLAKVIQFKANSKIMDLGTGGGFPGLPLAILFPNTDFLLVDSIGKKVKVAQEVADAIELKNLRTVHKRAEEVKEQFDFIVTRAVAKAEKLVQWCRKSIAKKQQHAMPNGIWAYKGLTHLEEEIAALPKGTYTEMYPMKDFYKEAFFETKCLLYINI